MNANCRGSMLPVLFTLIFILYTINSGTSATMNTITSSQMIKDSETISSSDDAFKLGFFSPVNTTNHYVGIWYLNQSNIIWVANRVKPVQDSSGVLTISDDNTNLVVFDGQKRVIWSSNVSSKLVSLNSNVTAQLQNNGNLVLIEDTTDNIIWESVKHPSNVFFANVIISTNQNTGEKVKITSWKTPSDPAIGKFSASIERHNAPEIFLWNQTKPLQRSGPWNGQNFLGFADDSMPTYQTGLSIARKDNGSLVEFTYTLPINSFFATVVVSSEGKWEYTSWMNRIQVQKKVLQPNDCDVYGICGPNGSCHLKKSPICTCLTGFKPRNVDEWNRRNWTSGCVRRATLQCERVKYNGSTLGGKEDGFLKLPMTKPPDFVEQSYSSLDTCRTECSKNCSCVAYAFDNGIRCLTWSGKLVDIVRFSTTGGVDLYIRQAYSELAIQTDEIHTDGIHWKRNITSIIIAMVIVGAIIVATCSFCFWSWASKRRGQTHQENQSAGLIGDVKQDKIEDLPLFEFKIISTATNNFGSANKIGQGGFGSVYKGELPDGREIAVKRLSRTSRQGLEEFMNEVIVISKLQHRNLVRLLGCCIEGEEKMLVYEYMRNNSLDFYLFDSVNKKVLDWQKRLNIIDGISRGLLYLHRDSRLRIIHRDLKPSNILLDREMNPKISDFGMAKIFGGRENEGNTRRIVGTYGYMSPEYAMVGLFSEKSDIFSFGVLLLEIISGRKNTSFYNHEQEFSLLGYAWKIWNEEEIVSLIDPEIRKPDYVDHILRCIHIGLLCVQEVAKERPTMATVVLMLNSEIVKLPSPSQPAFIQRQTEHRGDSSQQNSDSKNSVTLTSLQGR